ncbi:ABC transporter substrate-binding protein [Streptomyces aculeolatus]
MTGTNARPVLPGTNLSRRSVLRAGLAGAGALGLGGFVSACSGSSSESGNTITHWDWFVSQEPWVENEIALFQKANSGLTVKRTVTQTDAYPDLVSLSYRSDDLPDVLMIPDTPKFNDQVNDGWYKPLNDLASEEWIRSFPAYSFVEGVNVFDGKVYSAPNFTGRGPALQVYINNKVFKDAGLTDSDGSVRLPKTWDDVSRSASIIAQKSNGSVHGLGAGNTGGISLFHWMAPFLFPAGTPGALSDYGLDRRTGEYTFSTDRNYTDFLVLLKEWMDKEYFHPDTLSWDDEVARANFANGAFGMIVGGSWNILPWRDDHKFTDYSVVSLIGPEATPKGYYQMEPGGYQIAVSSSTDKAAEAFRWFRWWNGPEASARSVQKYLIGLSVHPDANDPSGIDLKPFADYVALADTAKLVPSPAVRNPDAAAVSLPPKVTPSISDVITGLVTGEVKDLSGALQKLDADSNAGLDQAIKDAVDGGAKVTRDDYVFADWDLTTDYTYESIPEYPTL